MEQETAPYSALFVFGDSLSDNGAAFALTGGVIPPTTLTGTDTDGNPVDFDALGIFFNQRLTNGLVFHEVTADLLGIPGDNSTFYDDLSGANFAVGAATASDLTAIGGLTINTLAAQVGSFQAALAELPGTEEENAAFLDGAAASIFIGLNDLTAIANAAATPLGFDQVIVNTGIAALLNGINTQASALAASGVGTIILNKLPSTAFFPSSNAIIDAFGPGTVALFDAIAQQINDQIDLIGAGLAAAGTNVETVDFFNLAASIQADAQTFGFLTLENALPNSDPINTLLISDIPIDQIGFIDPVHFTAELHEVFGAFQAMTLGNTTLAGDNSDSSTAGSEADETLFALAGSDVVTAMGGDDMIFAGGDSDTVFGGDGDDVVFGEGARDVLWGEEGSDVLSGGSGVDLLFGGNGADVLAGGTQADLIVGGAGDDVLIGGLGSDVLIGGAGDDIFIYRLPGDIGGTEGADTDAFFGGEGDDRLVIVSDDAIDDVEAFLTLSNVSVADIETTEVITSDALDTFDFGNASTAATTADLFGLV